MIPWNIAHDKWRMFSVTNEKSRSVSHAVKCYGDSLPDVEHVAIRVLRRNILVSLKAATLNNPKSKAYGLAIVTTIS